MLTASINFLTGRFVSSAFNDFDGVEWPPHPARVFYALVSALHEGDDKSEREVLEWLASQAPPEVYSSECSKRTLTTGEPVVAFVPVNPEPSRQGAGSPLSEGIPIPRERQRRTFPTAIPHVPIAYFVWGDASPEESQLAALNDLARRVAYLGHSSSFVSLTFSTGMPGVSELKQYVPSTRGRIILRVPVSGLLAELEEGFQLREEEKVRLPSAQERYEIVPEHREQPPVKSYFDSKLIIFRGVRGVQPLITAAYPVADAMRGALIRKGGGWALSELVSGHIQSGQATTKPHLAIVPLPDVGYRYSTGSIKGIAFVLPSAISYDERQKAMAAIAALGEEVRLRMGKYGVWTIEGYPTGGGLVSLSADTWIGPAYRWSTVTPIVLDRFPKKPYTQESAEIIAQSCERIGLPKPKEVRVSPFSKFIGVPPVAQFAPYRKKGLPPRIHVHAEITFDREVNGPVLVGAGRFVGMGLMRPS
jgi:CRISPR-associated protein Csb2